MPGTSIIVCKAAVQTFICSRIFYECGMYVAKNVLTVLITCNCNMHCGKCKQGFVFYCGMSCH